MKRYAGLAGSSFEEDPEGCWVEYDDVRAELERLRDEQYLLSEVVAEQESRLATATELLRRFQADDSAPQNLIDDTGTFLANQPAAPTYQQQRADEAAYAAPNALLARPVAPMSVVDADAMAQRLCDIAWNGGWVLTYKLERKTEGQRP